MIEQVFVGVSLLARLHDIEARQRSLDAERVEVLHGWVESGEWNDDGSANPAARLARETDVSRQQARERVKVAGLLHSTMVVTMASFLSLGWAKVRLLANVIDERTREAFVAHEEVLVGQALDLSVDQLAIVLQHWRRLVDLDGANADADAMHENQYVLLATSWRGEGFLKGRLDPETTASVKAALAAIADELRRDECRERRTALLRGDEMPTLRSASQLNAAALNEMARRAMATTAAVEGGRPMTPARPWIHLTIEVDDREALLARLPSGVPVSLHDAARHSCDAVVARVITKDGTVPLELGRSVREPSEGQRRALGALWSSCGFPGCDRPFAWCDLHHTIHWEDGGPTDVDLLIPLCRRHHAEHHRGRFSIRRRADGTFVFERPDGEVIGDSNPTISRLLIPLRRLAAMHAAA